MMNVLIIGYGYWGPKLSRNFSNSNYFNLHSISDLKSSSLKKAQKNYPNIETFKDYKKAIKLNKYDLVVVSTPTNTHYKIAKHALSKKLNVLVEKPLCNSLKDHKDLNKIAKKNNVNIFIDYPFIHSGSINFIKNLINSKKYGKLKSIESFREQAPIRKDTNVFWDLSIHDISLVNYLLNNKKIKKITTIKEKHKKKIFKKISIYLDYQNLHVFIKNNWDSPLKIRLIKFIFDKATLFLDENETLYKIKIYKKINQQFNQYSLEVPTVDLTEPLTNLINHIYLTIMKKKKSLINKNFYTFTTNIMKQIEKS